MAESPAHKFGQVIGGLLESIIRPQLDVFCDKHNLYLDHQQKDRPARPGKKVTWSDQYGNKHDLDFVIEREGSDNHIGRPLAFIEVAWRRYTKHSKNKAQEIQGAILPLAEKYRWNNPFLGTVLAGEFTDGSLDQLRSLSFNILYIPHTSLIEAFASEGIDIDFDEDTADKVFLRATKQIEKAPKASMGRILQQVVSGNQSSIDAFFTSLDKRLRRHVAHVILVPLYGRVNEFTNLADVMYFLEQHSVYEGSGDFRKYEIRVDFSNGDKVEAFFESKEKIAEFIEFISHQ